MSEPFLGEVRMVAFAFPNRGWALCNGQLLPIAQNQALFSLLGVAYGGNGQTTFALPDLRARIPLHAGSGFEQGNRGGTASHTLTRAEMPTHTHLAFAAETASTTSPSNAVWAGPGKPAYGSTPAAPMTAASVGLSGNTQPHENMPPYLTVNFIIATSGIFPSRN